MEQQELQKRWTQLIQEYSDLPLLAEETFHVLVKSYSSSGRAYHNLDHISQLLQTAEQWKHKLMDYQAVCLAIWFHDVIYHTFANDNEEKSAALAETYLSRLLLPEEQIRKVSGWIKATSHHLGSSNNLDTDLAYFLDFDLMILGAEEESYKIYSQQIREEYKAVPDVLYIPGRRKVLKRFLESNRIFKTEEFYRYYEVQARKNLQTELGQL